MPHIPLNVAVLVGIGFCLFARSLYISLFGQKNNQLTVYEQEIEDKLLEACKPLYTTADVPPEAQDPIIISFEGTVIRIHRGKFGKKLGACLYKIRVDPTTYLIRCEQGTLWDPKECWEYCDLPKLLRKKFPGKTMYLSASRTRTQPAEARQMPAL